MKVAFIGLGNMGLPMALNLLKGGIEVTGYDLSDEQLARFGNAGGNLAASAAQAAAGGDAVITMLPASRHVESTYLGERGLLAQAKPGTLFIDCSTIAPNTSRQVAAAAIARGVSMLDAPVSGGTGGAQAGTLTFMVGGHAEDLERARPMLTLMGKNIFHAGPHGTGQTVKVCNNMLLGILMVGTSEALRLGMANDVDPQVLSDIMSKSSGRNWTLETYNPCPGVMPNSPASNGYRGGFATDLMLKDLNLAVENAIGVSAAIPLGALVRNLYDVHSKGGQGGLDFSSVFDLLHNRTED